MAGGFAAGGRRGIVLAKEFKEVTTGGEQAVVVGRAVVCRQFRDQVQSRGWTVDHGDGDRAVEGDRGWVRAVRVPRSALA
ncbi:hypothetical protein AMK32_30380 [Streptomyces sp. CB01883]|nr:hypothetical protein AMK32_30380 [Streptomyces sp. CB01883]